MFSEVPQRLPSMTPCGWPVREHRRDDNLAPIGVGCAGFYVGSPFGSIMSAVHRSEFHAHPPKGEPRLLPSGALEKLFNMKFGSEHLQQRL
jgi:hypothetical protein